MGAESVGPDPTPEPAAARAVAPSPFTASAGDTQPGAPVNWHVYVLRCRDGSLYTGVTTDLAKRVAAHNAGRGAAYTRGRGPVALVYTEAAAGRAAAQRRERAIKRLRRERKLELTRAG